jgi:hypothetical protein
MLARHTLASVTDSANSTGACTSVTLVLLFGLVDLFDQIATWVFWCLVIFHISCFVAPALIFVFFGSIRTDRVDRGMEEGDQFIHPGLYQQLLDLGLKPLGSIHTHYWITLEGWNKRYTQRVFCPDDGKFFVEAWGRRKGEPVNVRLLSFFSDDYVLGTTNEFAGDHRLGKTIGQGILTGDLSQLFQAHRKKLDEMVSEGPQLQTHNDIDFLFREFHQSRSLPIRTKLPLLVMPIVTCVPYFALPCVTWWRSGFDPTLWVLPLGLCTGALLLWQWIERTNAVERRNKALMSSMAKPNQ